MHYRRLGSSGLKVSSIALGGWINYGEGKVARDAATQVVKRPTNARSTTSMLHRERVERDIMPVTEPRGIGLVVWSPLAQGMLTGKYDGGISDDSRFVREEWARDRYMNEENVARVQRLKPLADNLGVSRAQLALA